VVKQVLASLDVEEGYDPPDTTVRQVNLPPATVTLPRTWKAETGVGVWCPPGAPRPCLEHGGLKIRADGPFSPRTFSGTPAGGDGDAFDPRSEGMGCLDEGDTGASPSRFVVLVDRAVTQGGQDGRYLEFRMTCTTGSHVHRRWYFPSARVMIDSGRASDAVDRIVRSLEFER
jgi:hypothetical protein